MLPGRLSVCRTFGDFEAKVIERGGNPKVVIAIPEIKNFDIDEKHDFVFMGCDGIFDVMSNGDVVKTIWQSAHDEHSANIHDMTATAVEYIIKNVYVRKAMDNVTAVVVSFANFKRKILNG